jgi:hypothetical protein
LTSGCFNSDLQTLAAEIKSLIEPGAQRETTDGDAAAISRAIAVQVARAWTGRAASLWFLAPLAFPTALVFPGPCMPPTPPTPPVISLYLNMGLISGTDRLAAAYLAEQLRQALQETGAMSLGNAPAIMAAGGAAHQSAQAMSVFRVLAASAAGNVSSAPRPAAATRPLRATTILAPATAVRKTWPTIWRLTSVLPSWPGNPRPASRTSWAKDRQPMRRPMCRLASWWEASSRGSSVAVPLADRV